MSSGEQNCLFHFTLILLQPLSFTSFICISVRDGGASLSAVAPALILLRETDVAASGSEVPLWRERRRGSCGDSP